MTFSALKHAAVQTAAPLGPALFLAILSLWVFTRNNDFPLDYHPDERGKVLQLIDPTHTRNFNHPLLMLEAAAAVRRVRRTRGRGRFRIQCVCVPEPCPAPLIPAALQGWGVEFIRATGHEGLALSIPNTFSLKVSLSEMMPDVWLFLAFGMVALMARSVFDRSTVVLGFFLLTFGVVLSSVPFRFPVTRCRYRARLLRFWPADCICTSGLEAAETVQTSQVALALGLIVALQGTRCWRFDMQFADARQRLHGGPPGICRSRQQFWWKTTPPSIDRATLGGMRTRPQFRPEC